MTVTSPAPSRFITSAPGKVIIFGEHSAVFNKHAIAASVSSLRTYMLVEQLADDEGIELDFPNIEFGYKWDAKDINMINSEKVQSAFECTELYPPLLEAIEPLLKGLKDSLHYHAAHCFLYMCACLCPKAKGWKFTVKSTLPIGAGLGSSASISVCLALAMARIGHHLDCQSTITEDDREFINKWSFIGEKCIHGTPSGIDNAVATYGNAVQFQKQNNGSTQFKKLKDFPQLPMVLTNTKINRSTKILVAGVRDLVERKPLIAEPLLESMDQIAIRGAELLSNASKNNVHYEELLELVRINHGLLVSIGVSHPGLETIKKLSDELKIGETKLTGAGGGGCAFTLLKKDVDHSMVRKFHDTLHEEFGYQIFETDLGGTGCCFVDLNKQEEESIKPLFICEVSNQQLTDALLPNGKGALKWIY